MNCKLRYPYCRKEGLSVLKNYRFPFPGRRVGLLGGSFNPAHRGHRLISTEAIKRLRLDAVWWLVTPQNPLKKSNDFAKLEERLNYASKFANHPRIWVTDVERKFGCQYSIDTIRRLKRKFPKRRFVWLLGADNLTQMPLWQNWPKIFDSIPIAVFNRPSYCHQALAGLAAERFRRSQLKEKYARCLIDTAPPAWMFIRTPADPTSSTEIRGIQNQKSTSHKLNRQGTLVRHQFETDLIKHSDPKSE